MSNNKEKMLKAVERMESIVDQWYGQNLQQELAMLRSALENDDYGFSAVSEEELKQHEKQLQQRIEQSAEHKQQVVNTYEEKLGSLYQLIMPLLVNLQKNPEKEYILWPNRAAKIKEFIAKVDKIVE